MSEKAKLSCSFCGALQSEVRFMIAGPGGVTICSACVVVCAEIVAERQAIRGVAELLGTYGSHRVVPDPEKRPSSNVVTP